MTVDEARSVLEQTTPYQRVGGGVVVRDVRLLTAVAEGRRAGSVVHPAQLRARDDHPVRRVA